MARYVCDIESTPIKFPFVEKIHCTVLIDIDTEEVFSYRMFVPEERKAFLERYAAADLIVGHKFIGFDHPQIEHHYGVVKERHQVIDTLPLGRLVWSDIKKAGPGGGDYALYAPIKDWKAKGCRGPMPKGLPGGSLGLHGLEHWGYRFGEENKGDYSKRKEAEAKALGIKGKEEILQFVWGEWSEDMHAYMIQDGFVNLMVFRRFMKELEGRTDPHSGNPIPWNQSVDLTMRLQWICQKMERNGWFFDVKKANELYADLAAKREVIRQELVRSFPAWKVKKTEAPNCRDENGLFVPKKNDAAKGYVKGVPVQRYVDKEFNPASREHIYTKLIEVYGWEPAEKNDDKIDEFGETVKEGAPKVNDEILRDLAKHKGWKECELLADYFVLQKRIGAIAEGAQAWLNRVDPDGRIRASYNVNATVGGRASHSKPNIAQVPSLANADGTVPYGLECRELFYVPAEYNGKRWVQMGADQDGLELRCLGNFLKGWDKGAYLELVIRGDIHWANAKAVYELAEELVRYHPTETTIDEEGKVKPKKIKLHEEYRGGSKRVIYAMIYGGGDHKLGTIVGYTRAEARAWLKDPVAKAAIKKLKNKLLWKAKKFKDKEPSDDVVFLTYKGQLIRERLMGRFPALAQLIVRVQELAERGWIVGMDGRVLNIRSKHAALNTLLQSAGYVVCAQWLIEIEDACDAAGLKQGWDGDYVWLGWIHDEAQFAVTEDKREILKAIVERAGTLPSQPFPMWRTETVANADFGRNWAECH